MPPATPPLDPTALAQFGRLEVVARMLVEGVQIGQHKSPAKGSSIEFVEHRQYSPGDEVRHIDWRAYGKTGRYFVKEFEDETNLRCYLLVDASGSMAFSGRTLSKFDYARQLAAGLGYLLLHQRDAVGLITFDTQVRSRIEPSSRPNTFQQVIEQLEQTRPGQETKLSAVCQEILPTLKRRSLIVLLSDCFDDLTSLQQVCQQFRFHQHEILLLQIVAPEEETFPFSKPTQFRSLERSGQRRLVDPHRLRQHYLEQYQAFCKGLQTQAQGLGMDYLKLVTTEPYQTALGAYLAFRSRRKQGRSR